MRVGRRDAGAIELRGRQRQLVALAWRALLPWTLHVEPVALAPSAAKRAVDEDRNAEIRAARRQIVGRDHMVHQRLDERRLVNVEKRVALRGGHRGICGDRFGALGALWID